MQARAFSCPDFWDIVMDTRTEKVGCRYPLLGALIQQLADQLLGLKLKFFDLNFLSPNFF